MVADVKVPVSTYGYTETSTGMIPKESISIGFQLPIVGSLSKVTTTSVRVAETTVEF
jgi:hypothetical protein